MTSTKHSQLPWKMCDQDLEWDEKDDGDEVWVSSAHNHTLFLCDKEDAQFIVTACNSHYELVEALEHVTQHYEGMDGSELLLEYGSSFTKTIVNARNALAKVKP